MQSDINQPFLRLLHFNDNYDIQPSQHTHTGGAYYFKAHLDNFWNPQNTLTFFSGDAFSPSILSNLYEGQQMVTCLNAMRIDVACYGNHQFDFQYEQTVKLAQACNFPWLLGNLIYLHGHPLGEAKQHIILQKNGKKIGVFGVAQEQWLQLLTQQYQGHLTYIDFIQFSKQQVKYLKQKNCDIIIALTHMRILNDRKLAQQIQQIDFILGGHDHIIYNQKIKNVHIIKSGQNFQTFSVIDLFSNIETAELKNKNYSYKVHLETCTPTQTYDIQLKKYVDEKIKSYNQQTSKIVAYTLQPLDVRFQMVRTREMPYGNFYADLIRKYYNCDGVFLGAGSLRNGCILEAGALRLSQVSNVLDDHMVVKLLPGKVILQCLENSCSKYPSLQGRFLQISGIQYTFDASKPPGNRVVENSVYIGNSPLNLDYNYKISMSGYHSKGSDGFHMLQKCAFYIDQENSLTLLALLLKLFKPHQPHSDYALGSTPSLKRKSSKNQRMIDLAHQILLIQDRYYIQINPKLDGRIKILNGIQ